MPRSILAKQSRRLERTNARNVQQQWSDMIQLLHESSGYLVFRHIQQQGRNPLEETWIRELNEVIAKEKTRFPIHSIIPPAPIPKDEEAWWKSMEAFKQGAQVELYLDLPVKRRTRQVCHGEPFTRVIFTCVFEQAVLVQSTLKLLDSQARHPYELSHIPLTVSESYDAPIGDLNRLEFLTRVATTIVNTDNKK
jgi:hypothetical protein